MKLKVQVQGTMFVGSCHHGGEQEIHEDRTSPCFFLSLPLIIGFYSIGHYLGRIGQTRHTYPLPLEQAKASSEHLQENATSFYSSPPRSMPF